ncbi:hypothetical protein Sjap_001573 [Stephania japonica]|uniref:Uncharacterized protein n=1 Tax=Stephania japonica TaxID=461633 RepID=A0AAP0KK63_9MAGN
MLRMRFVQSRGAGEYEKGLAQAISSQCSCSHIPNLHLCNWMLCIQEQQEIGVRLSLRREPNAKSPTSMGLLLVEMVA